MSRAGTALRACGAGLALALLGAALACAAAPVRAAGVEAPYQDAATRFHTLHTRPAATAVQWRAVADAFRAIHDEAPAERRGADALFSAGLAGREAWRAGAEFRDLSRAVADFRAFVAHYGQDRLADDALMHLAALLADGFGDLVAARDTYRQLLLAYPKGDQQPAARHRLARVEAVLAATAAQRPSERPAPAAVTLAAAPAAPAATAASVAARVDYGLDGAKLMEGNAGGSEAPPPAGGHVKRVQFWTAPDWTRVILTTDPGVPFTVKRLGADADSPERVFFDLRAEPGEKLTASTPVDDGVLRRIRIGRFDAHTTRVVLDLGRMEGFEVKDFRLPAERKIVVDLKPTAAVLTARRKALGPALAAGAQRAPTPAAARRTPQPTPASAPPLPEPLVRAPVGLQVHSIMIDPGHGGHDPGALGYGVEEKSLVLEISRRLRDLLRKHHPELRVGLTRDSDEFIPLQQRPQIAKRFGADLFVSVHLNANTIRRFHGIETYFLNMTHDRDALAVAERENAGSGQHLADLNGILLDLLRDSNLIESGELAKTVQGSLVTRLRADAGPVRDLGVKQAPFVVLMGAEMPSVLVEAGFLTNRDENQRLRDSDYLDQIAQGIYDGLRRYIEQQNIIAAGHRDESLAANNPR